MPVGMFGGAEMLANADALDYRDPPNHLFAIR